MAVSLRSLRVSTEIPPAFCRDSLYFSIASMALGSGMAPGAAFSHPLGIISTINRIVSISLWFGGLELGVRTVSTG